MRKAIGMIQARMGSTRLPGKVLKEILGKPMLWHIVQRVRCVRRLSEVIVLTSVSREDELIQQFCKSETIPVFAGDESDVLDRFYQAALFCGADPIVRVTGDCPLVDPELIDRLIECFATGSYDHVSVATGAGALFLESGCYPDGLDAECFSFAALKQAWSEAIETSDREHVTPYIWRVPGRFRCHMIQSPVDYSHWRWTVDHLDDFRMIVRIYEALYRDGEPFLFPEVIDHLKRNPELASMNQSRIGCEGYEQVWHPQAIDGSKS